MTKTWPRGSTATSVTKPVFRGQEPKGRSTRYSRSPSATISSCEAKAFPSGELAGEGMPCRPVPGNVQPPRDPDSFMALDIVEEAREAGRPRRMADQAHMEADRHHLRLSCAFRVEHVEGVLMPREIIGRRSEETGAELAVIVDERIGNDQMRLAVDDFPIGQFVVVRVGIIEEAALLHHEPAGVHAWPIAA